MHTPIRFCNINFIHDPTATHDQGKGCKLHQGFTPNQVKFCVLDLGLILVLDVSRRHLTAEAWITFQFNLYGICGGHSDRGAVSLRIVCFFPPANVIPTMFHARSFMQPRRCIMFVIEIVVK